MEKYNQKIVEERFRTEEGNRQPEDYCVELYSPAREDGLMDVCLGQDPEELLILTDSAGGLLEASRLHIASVYYRTPGKPDENVNAAWVIEGAEGLDFEFLDRLHRRAHRIPWLIARTKRLRIREMTEQDVPALYELYAEPSVAAYVEPLYEQLEDELAFTRAYINNMYEFYGFGLWIVEEGSTGRMVGRAGLSMREGYDGMELGYLISEKFRGRGLAGEACRAVVEYAVSELNCRRLNAFVEDGNIPSVNLLKKLGFHCAGTAELLHKGEKCIFHRFFVSY